MLVYFGLGSNIGDASANVLKATAALDALEGIRVKRRSSLYRTKPWGKEDQDYFTNAVVEAEIEPSLAPQELLRIVKDLENRLGRLPGEKWGPRLIDIDILLMGDLEIESDELTIPHRYMLERAFVMFPMVEIVPELIIKGRTVMEYAAELDPSEIEVIYDVDGVK